LPGGALDVAGARHYGRSARHRRRAGGGDGALAALLRAAEVAVSHMLFESDNHYAEQLLRTVGAHGPPSARSRVRPGRNARARSSNVRFSNGSVRQPTACAWSTAAPRAVGPGGADRPRYLLARANLDPTGDVLFHDLPRVASRDGARHDVTTALGGRGPRAATSPTSMRWPLCRYAAPRARRLRILVNDSRADDGVVDDGIDSTLDI